MSDRISKYTPVLEALQAATKPNFTQYQLAIQELAAETPEALLAFQQVRHTLENSYKLESLNRIVDKAFVDEMKNPKQ